MDERTTSTEQRRRRALAEMPPCLREEYDRLAVHVSREDAEMARRRYSIGEIVRRVAGDASYGANAVKLLAEALGREQGTLYDAARVATCWSSDAFAAALALPSRRPLSFSHFVTLSSVEDSSRREQLLARCRIEGLSVRALEQHVQRARPSRSLPEIDVVAAASAHVEDSVERVRRLTSPAASSADWQDVLLRLAIAYRNGSRAVEAKLSAASQRKLARMSSVPGGGPAIVGTFHRSVTAVFGGRLERDSRVAGTKR